MSKTTQIAYDMINLQLSVTLNNVMDGLLDWSFTSIIPSLLKVIVTLKSAVNLAVLANNQ